MPITEELMKPGQWTLTLLPTVPATIRAKLLPYGHVVITPTRLIPFSTHSDGTILGNALYTGIVQHQDGPFSFGGLGLLAWIGDGDGKGDVITTRQTFSADTLDDVFTALLPAGRALEVGTVTTTGLNTVEASFLYVTVREAIESACRQAGAEYRVNPDGTIDAADPDLLFESDPEIVVTPISGGIDGVMLRGLDVVEFTPKWTAEEWTSQVVALGQGEGDAIIVGAATIGSNPYKDLHGNAARQDRLVDASDVTDATAAGNVAANMLNLFSTARTALSLSTDTYAIPLTVRPGDTIYVYDPASGIIDTSNPVLFRGQTIHPQTLRVYGYTWPIVRGMGVYYRAGDGTWTDLSEYVAWEDGQATTYDVGAPKLPLTSGGYQPNRQTAERAATLAWQSITPTWVQGVTEGNGTYGTCRWRVRKGSDGQLEIDYIGHFTLGSTSAITDAPRLEIPGGYTSIANAQYFHAAYIDNITTYVGAASAPATNTYISFLNLTAANFGVLSATVPFTWTTGDQIRWDIRGLMVAV